VKHIQVLYFPRFSRESLVLTVRVCVQAMTHVFRIKHCNLVVKYNFTWREKIRKTSSAWLHFYIFCLVEIVE